MNILLIGSGGREHAIAWALAKSPKTEKLYVAPGNGGTAAIAQNVTGLDVEDGRVVAAWAEEHGIDLAVIGPEAPLVAGVADALREAGIDTFGPGAQGAQLEGSKVFAKEFMSSCDIPTAAYRSFTEAAPALAYLEEHGAPVVIKADGLAAGKGVTVAATVEEAAQAITESLEGRFGEAGSTVLIEDCLEGPECSMLAFVSNGRAVCMPTSQDHKRAYDGDLGPNTGGMGVYSPVPQVTEAELEQMHAMMDAAGAATAAAPFDADYRGVLYGGFMLTENGPMMLEFNARFGDPETQVILPRFEGDLVEVMQAVAQGRPEDVSLSWSAQSAVCVVLASEGYPGAYEKGRVILGIDEAEQIEGVTVFHAGTALNADGELVTNGGRVLNVVGKADTFAAARELAYKACDLIQFEGKQFRSDIGYRCLAYTER